jgi:hypothetical protein
MSRHLFKAPLVPGKMFNSKGPGKIILVSVLLSLSTLVIDTPSRKPMTEPTCPTAGLFPSFPGFLMLL